MTVFNFTHISLSPIDNGRQLVRAVVQNRHTGRALAIWEHLENGRMMESVYAAYRTNPLSSSLKRFLLLGLDNKVVDELMENGGYEWRAMERYRALMTDLERRLSTQFPARLSEDTRKRSPHLKG